MKKGCWQHPFVDVFRHFKLQSFKTSGKKGNVKDIQDTTVGRRVVSLVGAIPASNYVEMPTKKSCIKSLGLSGKYVYIQFQFYKKKFFNIHLDFQVQQSNPVRITLTNLFQDKYRKAGNNLSLPVPIKHAGKWICCCVDVGAILKRRGYLKEHPGFRKGLAKKMKKSMKRPFYLKHFKICSNLKARGIFTSDNLYDPNEYLPQQMQFRKPKGEMKWEDQYCYVTYPKKLVPDVTDLQEKENQLPSLSKQPITLEEVQDILDDDVQQTLSYNVQPIQKDAPPTVLRNQRLMQEAMKAGNQFEQEDFGKSRARQILEKLKIPESVQYSLQFNPKEILYPQPIMRLEHVLGFSGRCCPDIRWNPCQEHSQDLIYSAGKLLVSLNTQTQHQRFFYGSSTPITNIEVFNSGQMIVTVNNDHVPQIKIWDYADCGCVQTYYVEQLTSILCLTLSINDKCLAVTGQDSYRRECIIVLNLEDLNSLSRHKIPQKMDILARQVACINITSIKFSSIENDKLVSCGKENIRFWRIKNQHLPGNAVVLDRFARNTHFTALAFEQTGQVLQSVQQQVTQPVKVYVGTKTGLLYQIDYHSRELDAIYRIHDSAICNISTSPGFCVTGSQDQFLRVWPLDFSEFFFDARHEGIVVSIDISRDGLKVGCGTSNGGLGIIDLQNQHYQTKLRSHTLEVLAIALQKSNNFLISLSKDLTIRIWDVAKREQVYEFSFPQEDQCLTISAHPTQLYFAGGFYSGSLRIFDIEKMCICKELAFYVNKLKQVQYSPDGKLLIAVDHQSAYTIFDTENEYAVIKSVQIDFPSNYQYINFSSDGSLFGLTGDYGNYVLVYETKTKELLAKIRCKNTFVNFFKFSNCGMEMFVATENCNLRRYSIETGKLIRELPSIHRDRFTSFDFTKNSKFIVTVGSDSLVKVWDYQMRLVSIPGSCQLFIGHTNSINNVLFSTDNKKIYTAGGFEGIFEWEFLGDVEMQEPPMVEEEIPVLQIETPQELQQEEQPEEQNIYEPIQEQEEQPLQQEQETGGFQDFQETPPQQSLPVIATEEEVQIAPKSNELIWKTTQKGETFNIHQYREKHEERLDPYRQKYELPMKHFSLSKTSKYLPKKLEQIKKQNHYLQVSHVFNRNSGTFQLDFISGQNNNCANNVVWNAKLGWIAYSVENFNNRNQRVLTFPDYISTIKLSPDQMQLAVGAGTYNQDIIANVYIVECVQFKVSRKLQFHTKGLQGLAFSSDGSYLISIGNHKENTLAVWDWHAGKLITSTYTINILNDVKCQKDNKIFADYMLQFCTGGNDVVSLWRVKEDCMLESDDIKIDQVFSAEIQITAVEYFYPTNTAVMVLVGMQHGEILCINTVSLNILTRVRFCHSEILQMCYSNKKRNVVISSTDSFLYKVPLQSVVTESTLFSGEDDGLTQRQKLNFPAMSLSLDPANKEAVVGTTQGVYFTNFAEEFTSLLVGSPSWMNPISQCINIEDELIATVDLDGIVQVWNISTAEEIMNLDCIPDRCSYICYVAASKQLMCFYNKGRVRQVRIDELNVMNVMQREVSDLGGDDEGNVKIVMGDYFIDNFGQQFILVSNKNKFYYADLKHTADRVILAEVLTTDKTVSSVTVHRTNGSLFVAYKNGEVETYKFLHPKSSVLKPKLKLVDSWNLTENPHEKEVQSNSNVNFYKYIKHEISVVYQEDEPIYFCSTKAMQYVFIRNFLSGEVVGRIYLESFPTALSFNSKKLNLIVGHDDGFVTIVRLKKQQQTERYRSYLDGSIQAIAKSRQMRNLVLFHETGFCSYKY